MRVLHVIPSVSERSGGPATAIVPMCRALMQQGIELLLLTTDFGLRVDEACDGEHKGVPAKFFPSQLGESFKYSRPLAAWLSSNIRRFGLAHIHAVFNHSSVAAAQVCRKAGVPYIIRPLGTLDPWSMTQRSLRKRVFWRVCGKTMLSNAAAVHYTTGAEKIATEGLLGLNHGKVIPLGIEANGSGATSSDKLVQYFPALARKPYVLVLSRLHPKKGLDVLLEAFLALVGRDEFAQWRLVIAGDGPADYVLRLKTIASSSSHRDRIQFTGWLDGEEKNALLGGAAVLALPSYQENFGLCVMEALSHAVPVLVSRNVNLAGEIATANAGWIADINKESLLEKLSEALGDENERAKRGRAGKQLSLRYSWDNTARALADLYRDLLHAKAV
jgi:glycosyltransferase involved in cell wall biosynthesis